MQETEGRESAATRLDYDEILQEIKNGSSRSAIILGVAFIDDILRAAIAMNFIKLSNNDEAKIFSGEGPLSTFSARIKLALAMGLISRKLRKDLDRLRKIRNEYAHKALKLRLSDKPHDELIRELNSVSDLENVTELSTQEILSKAVEKISLYLIFRTSPPSIIADDELVEDLKCLDFSNFAEVKRRAIREPYRNR